jgi:CBS domain containing-hemolysin-like protein
VSDLTGLLLAVVLLGLNAFFVGAEFALISARRTRLEPRAAAGSKAARTTLRAMENVSLMMAGAQFGITVCSLGLGAIGEPAVAHLLEPAFERLGLSATSLHAVAFTVALALVVYAHVVIGEMVPKNIALAGPERAALVLAPPLVAVVTVLKPFIRALNAVSNGLLRLARVQPRAEVASTFNRQEVAGLIEQSRTEGLLDADEYDLLIGALGLRERTVSTVVMPLSELVTVRRGASVSTVERICAATGFSRLPVTDGNRVVGYLHIKDVLEPDPAKRRRPVADKWIRPMAAVRHTDLLHEALQAMQARGTHMARVGDEHGRVRGVVTLEDVLEELVGEIRDASHAVTLA